MTESRDPPERDAATPGAGEPAQPLPPPTGVDTRRWSRGAQRALWFGIGCAAGFVGLCFNAFGSALTGMSAGGFGALISLAASVGGLVVLQVVVVRRSRNRPQVRWGAYLCGWLAPWVLIVGASVGFSLLLLQQMSTGPGFDQTQWQSAPDVNTQIRESMADDLLDSGDLDGLARREVFDLLGHDTFRSGVATPFDFDPQPTWTYRIGDRWSNGVKLSRRMVVTFGEDDVVESVEIVEVTEE